MTVKLKPCPFCGGKAVIRESLGYLHISPIHKENCFIKPDTWTMAINGSLKKQIQAWNRRADDDR